jgi:hypothetical protein
MIHSGVIRLSDIAPTLFRSTMKDEQLTQAPPARQIANIGNGVFSQSAGITVAPAVVSVAVDDGVTKSTGGTIPLEARTVLAECLSIFASRGKAIRLNIPTNPSQAATAVGDAVGGLSSKADSVSEPAHNGGCL